MEVGEQAQQDAALLARRNKRWKLTIGLAVLLVVAIVAGVVAVALGGGGGGTVVLTTSCSESLVRGQCSSCKCMGRGDSCTGPVLCTACKAPYAFQNSTADSDGPIREGSCAFTCPSSPEKRPEMPANMLDLNGIAWPEMCLDGKEDQHFFVIGDWGGEVGTPPKTFVNRATVIPEIDIYAQVFVAGRMAAMAKELKPKFVINVGDNFYPGGISGPGTCNAETHATDAAGGIVFKQVFEDVYKGEGLDGVEWWGVLGNHDYGGYHYSVHWDQNVFYTWHSEKSRWLTPALYWSRKTQFRDFSADFFFVDTNRVDVYNSPDTDSGHNICSRKNNLVPPLKPSDLSCPGTTMTSPDTCWKWFTDLWKEQKKWLAAKLEASVAEWQIIVTHYPPTFEPPRSEVWEPYFEKYGVDLYISGHTHQQQLVYKDKIFGDTAYIISGGGGGITSEILPSKNGHDDAYGFMDVTITKDEIKVVQYSHGGIANQTIIRNTTLIAPRSRNDYMEIQL